MTVRCGEYSLRNSVAVVPRNQQSACLCPYGDCKNSDKRGITCFIDLQIAYDSVDRELLWEVLTRFGEPANILAVIPQFHDGMPARVHTDEREHSECFDVTRRLRQGCILSLLLFKMFFAAATHVVLVRFSGDKQIIRYSVHLEGCVVVGNGVLMACIRRVVWGMLYVDDVDIGSRSAEGLAEMMTAVVTVFKAAGLTLSERWMGTMLLRTPGLYIPGSTVRHRTSWLEL